MADFSIRRAGQSDARLIRLLARSRRVSSSSNATTGLIDYPVPSEAKYLERILMGDVLIAEDARERVLGFLDAYRDDAVQKAFPKDPITARICEIEQDKFSYINTAAVRKKAEGMGVARALMFELENHVDAKMLWTAVVHRPIMNYRSAGALEKYGFILYEEIPAFEKMLFGLYCKPVSRTNVFP